METDIRPPDSTRTEHEGRRAELIQECLRQEDACQYTAATFYHWLAASRRIQRIFIVTPIVLGALATWSVINDDGNPLYKWLTATSALLAGILPAVYEALKFGVHMNEITRLAGEFKNLEHGFRQAAHIAALGPFSEFKAEFDGLMKRAEAARGAGLTPPDRHRKAAEQKIEKERY
jgi:hypothetical protein